MTQPAVAERLATKADAIPSASIVSLNNRADFYEVVTPNENAAEVREAVLAALGPDLKIELPSRFVGAQPGGNTDVQKVLPGPDTKDPVVLPIENDKLKVDGKPTPDIGGYVGGAAIVLKDLSPAISAQEIQSRIDRAAAAPPETNLSRYKYEVVPFINGNPSTNKADLDKPVSEAVVLVQQPDFLYSKSADAWRDNVAGIMWRLTNEGVGREAKLQRVSNFDPQVAGDAQREAFMATILSILAIMVYIWFRFGDMKYATATVAALVHDTLAVVGAIGLSHYLDNGFGHALMIEPFRINVTLVAAILTIMGYSMIDTIVVFDRIRENRGRYGRLTRQVINDSINQTLSRTLLTAGTTLITVTTMYLLGGPAIHGFTFVLLVGILIGTYSSIAIASPILLLGAGKEAAAAAEESKSSVGPGARVGGAQLRPR
jgi:SecD/SecF fusion protein